MSRVSKAIAEAVRTVVEPLECRRLLTTVTLTGQGDYNDFYAKLNSTTGNVDFYVNHSPGTGTPEQSVPAAQVSRILVDDPGQEEASLSIDVPGVTAALEVSGVGASNLDVQVVRGGITIDTQQDLSYVSVEVGGAMIMSATESSFGLLSINGLFQHSAGTISTSALEISSSGVFIDAGGAISSGIAISNAGTFKAAFAGSLAGTTGTFLQSGLFIVDVGSGNTNTLGMSFSNVGSSVFDLVSGTTYLSNFNSASANYASLQIDGTAGTLRLPEIDMHGYFRQTGGTLTVDNGLQIRANADLVGGAINAGWIGAGWFTQSHYTFNQSAGTIHANAFNLGQLSSGSTWNQTGGTNFFSNFAVSPGSQTASIYNLSGGSVTADNAAIGDGGLSTLNLSGTGSLKATSETVGLWGGTGTVNQTGGTNLAGTLIVGYVINGTGHYNLSGGTLTAEGEVIGLNNWQPGSTTGTFVQTGGTNTATGLMTLAYGAGGNGQYDHNGGTLHLGGLRIGIGDIATFNQSAGDTNIDNVLVVGDSGSGGGTLNLSGGTVHVSGYTYVGNGTDGVLNQTGGSVSIDGTLYITGYGYDVPIPGAHGAYNLSGVGQLSASNIFVGYNEDGSITQSGGTITVNNFVKNGPSGSVGTVTRTAGTLNYTHLIDVLRPTVSGQGIADEGTPYQLNLSATSDIGNNAVTSWGIDWGDNGVTQSISGNPNSISHTFIDGSHTYHIGADAYSGTRTYSSPPVDLLVTNKPAIITPFEEIEPVPAGTPISFYTDFVDPGVLDTHTATIQWDDGTISTSTGPDSEIDLTEENGSGSIFASHTSLMHGHHTATLYLTDSDGATSSATFTFDVEYVAPTFGISVLTDPVVAGKPAMLSMSANGPEAAGVTDWEINWGDGTTTQYQGVFTSGTPNQASWNRTHTYAASGTYIIHASATDAAGSHSAGTLAVTVKPGLKSPTKLSAADITESGLTLSWLPGAGEEIGFKVYASKNGAPFDVLSVAARPSYWYPGLAVEKDITSLDPSSTYVFKVSAYGDGVESQASQVVLVRTPSNTLEPLSIDGLGQTTVGSPARWSARGGSTSGQEDSLNYVWSVLSNGRSVASGQGRVMTFLPSKSGYYSVTLTAVSSHGVPLVTQSTLYVNDIAEQPCTVIAPPISEVDRFTVLRIDGTNLDYFGSAVPDDEAAPIFDWIIQDEAGALVTHQVTNYDSLSFVPRELGNLTISVTVTRADGSQGYRGSASTTVTIGAPDDYKKGFSDFGLANETAHQVIEDQSGNFVVIGSNEAYPLPYRVSPFAFAMEHTIAVTRFTPELTVDSSWGSNGKLLLSDTNVFFGRKFIRELDDGSFLVVSLASTNDTEVVFIKLSSNGVKDPSFGEDGIVHWHKSSSSLSDFHISAIQDMAVSPDGSIVLALQIENSSLLNGSIGTMRFNSDGTLDDGSASDTSPQTVFGDRGLFSTTFESRWGPYSANVSPRSILLADDGSIYVAGHSNTGLYNESATGLDDDVVKFFVFKLTNSGELDTTFGKDSSGIITISFGQGVDYGYKLMQDSIGRLVVAGTISRNRFTTPFQNIGNTNIGITRLTVDGQIDTTFGPNGTGRVRSNFYGDEAGWDAVMTSDDKIVVAGGSRNEVVMEGFPRGDGLVARFTADGVPDETFGNGGKIILDGGMSVLWQSVIIASDNDIVVAGGAERKSDGSDDGFGIAKYRPGDVAARDLTATATIAGTVVLNWVDAGSDEDGFIILRSTSPVGPSGADIAGMAPSDSTAWTDTSAAPGQKYYYKVVAFDTFHNARRLRGQTNVATAQTSPKNASYVLQETVMVPVTGETVLNTFPMMAGKNYRFTARGFFSIDGNPDLASRKKADSQWGLFNPSPSRYGVIGKRVQYGIGINDEMLDLNRFPYWGEPSTDASHTYSVDFSPETSAPVKLNFHDNYYPDNQPGYVMLVDIYRSLPAAPEQVDATVDRARRRIGVTWTNTAIDADRVVLQRSVNGGEFSPIATLSRQAALFSDTDIVFNHTYAYRLIARNSFGDSGYSNEAVAVMTNLPPQVDFVDPVTVRVGTPVTLQISATDPDMPGSPIGYLLSGAPAGTSIDAEGRIAGFTVNASDIRRNIEDSDRPYYLGQTLVWRVVATDEAGGTAERYIALTIAPAENTIPNVATPPYVISQTDTGASVGLLGSDDGPESGLTYQWITKKRPFGVKLPTFSENGTNAAKNPSILFYAAGTYTFEVRVGDGSGYYASADLTMVVAPILSGVQVVDPLVELAAGETHAFAAVALDQFQRQWLPGAGTQPTFSWAITSATPHGQIDATTGVYAAPLAVSTAGNEAVRVTATLAGVSKSANANVSLVIAGNLPPEIEQIGDEPRIDAEPLSFSQLRLNVFAHDPDGAAADLTYTWEANPAGVPPVVFSDNGTNAAAETIATCPTTAALNYKFKVTVTDKRGGTTWAEITLTDTREFKTVDLTPKASMLGVGKSTTFHAVARDQYGRQLLTQPVFEWRVDGVIAPGQTADDFVYTAPAEEGQHVVTAAATSQGVIHSSSATLSVLGQRPADLKIISPSQSADVGIPVLVDQATPVDIVVDDINDDPVTWFLWLTPKSGNRILLTHGTDEVGSAPTQGARVATMDPTTFEDGLYSLQLTATSDANATVQDQRQVRIASKFKIGSLRLPFVDARIQPASGDSLAATRLYDSMTANVKGDFGYGWSLETNVRPDRFISTAHTGKYEDHGVYAYRTGDLVYLTTPDGQQHAFGFFPKKNGNGVGSIGGVVSYSPRFVAVDGSRAELTVAQTGTILGNTGLPVELRSDLATGEWFYSIGTGSVALGYNPSKNEFGRPAGTSNQAYTLKTEDGTSYHYDQSGRLHDSVDNYSNSVSYAGGSATPDRQFAVRWDAENRITGISDVPGFSFPADAANNTQYVEYAYDAAGDLVSVRDRTLQTTTFAYETIDGVSTHRLINITDSRGVHVATASYDSDSHLLNAVADSTGQGTNVTTRSIGNGQSGQTATNAAGDKSEVIYGDHGDVVREIKALRSAAGTLTGYEVTQHDYAYGLETAAAFKQADTYGVTNINKLFWSVDYAPFVIKGADQAGQRFTLAASRVVRRVDYKFIDGSSDFPENDPGLFQPASIQTLGAHGLETTRFLRYFSPGRPSITENADGQRTWMLYDAQGQLTSTVNAFGEGTQTEYDAKGRVVGTYRVTADVTGPGFRGTGTDLPTVTRANKLSTTTYYAVTDAITGAYAGKVASTTDEAAQVADVSEANKLRTRYTYCVGGSADGQTKAVLREWTDAHGTHSVRDSLTEYDGAGRAVKVTDAHGRSTETRYDAFGQVAFTVDAFGGRTASVYDARGQTIRTVYPDGTETRTAYDALGRTAFTTDRFFTGATIDANGGLSAASNTATSLVTRTLYDCLGRVTGTERYRDGTIAITADGAVLKAVAPDAGQLTSSRRLAETGTAYDDEGRVSETKDAAGLTTQSEYYDNGQVKRTRTVAAGVASPWTAYDYRLKDNLPAGTVSYDSVTDANGHTTKSYKDALGRVVKTVYADGSFADMAYGPFGSVTKTYDQRKSSDAPAYTERQYDLSGRLTDLYLPAVADASNGNAMTRPHWQYAYDAAGRETGQLDPKGSLTTFGYDDYGQRTSRTMPPDGDGNLANDAESWTYDAFGRVAAHVDFKRQTTQYVYDDTPAHGGRLTKEQRFTGPATGTPAEKTAYGYDDLGRQSTVDEYVAGDMTTPMRHTTTTFDSVTGGVTQITSPEGVLNHAYDPATSRLTRTWTTSNDTAYRYDGHGRRLQVVVTKLNGVVLATPLVTAYAYDAVGNLLTTTQDEGTATTGDDLVTTDTYDTLNRLDTLIAKRGATLLFDQDYDYESDGQKDKVTEHRGSVTAIYDWTYDAINRLTDESYTNGGDSTENYSAHYKFDLASNRVGKTQTGANAATTASNYNARDELATTQTDGGPVVVPQYDPNGNTLTDGSHAFTWDLRNRMQTATTAGVTTAYAYDENGVRTGKRFGTGPTRTFVNDALNPTGYSKPIEEKVNGNIDTSYVIGITVLGQQTTGSPQGYLSLVQDGQGKARGVMNLSGVDVQPADYDAFGNTLQPGQSITSWQNPDGYTDFETGLTQQLARSFDRTSGVAASQDATTFGAGEWQDANLRSYVGGSPVTGTDPSGHFTAGEIALSGLNFAGRMLFMPTASVATFATRAVFGGLIFLGKQQLLYHYDEPIAKALERLASIVQPISSAWATKFDTMALNMANSISNGTVLGFSLANLSQFTGSQVNAIYTGASTFASYQAAVSAQNEAMAFIKSATGLDVKVNVSAFELVRKFGSFKLDPATDLRLLGDAILQARRGDIPAAATIGKNLLSHLASQYSITISGSSNQSTWSFTNIAP